MEFVRNTAYNLIFGLLFLYFLMVLTARYGSLFLPSEMYVWLVDSRIELCKRENLFLDILVCDRGRSMSWQSVLFGLTLCAAAIAYAGWMIKDDLKGRTTVSKLKYITLLAAGSTAIILVIWTGGKAWDPNLYDFSIDDVVGTWEPSYQGSVVSLTLSSDGKYIYKVVTKQNGTFENTNLWKIIVLRPDEIPGLTREWKVIEFSSFKTKQEFDECEVQQSPCAASSDAGGYISRSVLGHMKMGVYTDTGYRSFRKVK